MTPHKKAVEALSKILRLGRGDDAEIIVKSLSGLITGTEAVLNIITTALQSQSNEDEARHREKQAALRELLTEQLRREDVLQSEMAEMRELLDLQHTRTAEADALWREAHPDQLGVHPDLGRLIGWLMQRADALQALRARVAQLEEVLNSIMLGGNHLASMLVGSLGAEEARFPPFTASFEQGREIVKDPDVYDVWVCWKIIMDARATLSTLSGERQGGK